MDYITYMYIVLISMYIILIRYQSHSNHSYIFHIEFYKNTKRTFRLRLYVATIFLIQSKYSNQRKENRRMFCFVFSFFAFLSLSTHLCNRFMLYYNKIFIEWLDALP